MAHCRQEVGFGGIGLFGFFLRGDRFRGAYADGVLKRIAVTLQLPVALVDPAEHVIEGVDQHADFIVRFPFQMDGEIGLLVDMRQFPGQGVKRTDNPPDLAAGKQDGQENDERTEGQRDKNTVDIALSQPADIGVKVDFADHLSVVQDVAFDAERFSGYERPHAFLRRRAVPADKHGGAADFSDQHTVGTGDPGEPDGGKVTQSAQNLQRPPRIGNRNAGRHCRAKGSGRSLQAGPFRLNGLTEILRQEKADRDQNTKQHCGHDDDREPEAERTGCPNSAHIDRSVSAAGIESILANPS